MWRRSSKRYCEIIFNDSGLSLFEIISKLNQDEFDDLYEMMFPDSALSLDVRYQHVDEPHHQPRRRPLYDVKVLFMFLDLLSSGN